MCVSFRSVSSRLSSRPFCLFVLRTVSSLPSLLEPPTSPAPTLLHASRSLTTRYFPVPSHSVVLVGSLLLGSDIFRGHKTTGCPSSNLVLSGGPWESLAQFLGHSRHPRGGGVATENKHNISLRFQLRRYTSP